MLPLQTLYISRPETQMRSGPFLQSFPLERGAAAEQAETPELAFAFALELSTAGCPRRLSETPGLASPNVVYARRAGGDRVATHSGSTMIPFGTQTRVGPLRPSTSSVLRFILLI